MSQAVDQYGRPRTGERTSKIKDASWDTGSVSAAESMRARWPHLYPERATPGQEAMAQEMRRERREGLLFAVRTAGSEKEWREAVEKVLEFLAHEQVVVGGTP